MSIWEYLRMRIQSAESILASEELAGNVPKAMAEKAAIAELRGVEDFLNNASKSSEVPIPCDNMSCDNYCDDFGNNNCDNKDLSDIRRCINYSPER